ncbi:PREDICTED: premnaspirodiene oxygenase-like [Ipomoea nil]|uniref:premnaspirodiene oxygenase-like n=1 Tax=Ipomoea nil TaxID=35883 RepID=UPI0009013328|nr:PREDICTED: premnaspirodiene oxygenase-like [Ipomoea nil]
MEHKFLFNPVSVIVFLSFVFCIYTLRRRSNPARRQKLPPGPWKLPLIGSLHHLVGGSLPHRTLRNLSRKYGPIMHLQLGEISAIVISSPQLAKAITKTHDLVFANRPKMMSFDVVYYKCTDVAFSPYGDYWRQMRKICVLELLSTKMVKSFNSFRQEELSELISSIKASGSAPINLTEKICWFTSSTIAKAAFGRVRREDQERFIVLVKEALSLAGGFGVADLFPSKKWIHYVSGTKPRLLKVHREVDKIFELIIEEHKDNMANRNNNKAKDHEEDIVDVLLRVMEGGELQIPITRDNIKAVINDMFSAGVESSATTLIWAMSEMMKNPSVMSKAHAEVREVLKGKKTFDNKELENLTYLNFVIKETLRLHAPIPLLAPRESMQETQIDNYIIPPKTRVFINAWAIATDPKYWKDPERFLPERFENSSVEFMGNHYEFIPFGSGRRMCPGISFSLASIAHSLAALLYHFDWEIPSGVSPNDLDMNEGMGIAVAKKEDLCLIAQPFIFEP